MNLAAALGCPFEGEVDPATVLRLFERVPGPGPARGAASGQFVRFAVMVPNMPTS